jgi:hypothetical protein
MAQREKTKQDTIGKQGYALRRQGLTWSQISQQLGGNVHSIEKLVVRFAKDWGKPWPIYTKDTQPYNATKRMNTLVRGEVYYTYMIEHKKSCTETAQDLNESVARVSLAAKAWAKENNLPWPRPIVSGGQRAYRMRQTGAYWRIIALLLGYSHRPAAVNAARSYALQHHLPWPPEKLPKKETENENP